MGQFSTSASGEEDPAQPHIRKPYSLALAALFSVLSIVTLVVALHVADDSFTLSAGLAALLIGGSITFILMLAGTVSGFQYLNLTNPKAPLGLPEGSVQAIIALTLILLFFIMAVFLYGDLAHPEGEVLLTKEQLAKLEPEEMAEARPAEGAPDMFAVVLNKRNPAAEDLARQIVTTVATLVVAVASFYFGAKSVQQATERATEAAVQTTR